MKKIIDGKIYDTEKDETRLIGKHWNGYPVNDFKHCREELYCTENGNYFLYGEGGAMSRYAESCGDMMTDGSDIIRLTQAEALQWAEQHLSSSDIIEEFEEQLQQA